ncbi:MAG: pyrroline-5-carboxylate reductase dimerization domain-containing protein [Sphingobium sp.]
MAKPEDAAALRDWSTPLLLIGCGNMAGQMLARWLACGLDPASVTVVRPSGRSVAPGVQVVTAMPGFVAEDAVVLLGMKPYQLAEVARALAPLTGASTTILSILAGTPLVDLRAHFPRAGAVVRAMPNLPVGIGQGVTALHGATDGESLDKVQALLTPLGLVEPIADEALFNAVTALSGCGPAFAFRFIDALAQAGAALGLPQDQAQRMALATVQGAAVFASASDTSPAILADRVASPGGMTREGLNMLDADDRLARLMVDTLRAARDWGVAMARGE